MSKEAILKRIEEWRAASQAKDIDRLQEMVTEDCVFLVTGRPPTRGKEEMGKMMQAAFSKMDVVQHFDVDEIQVAGDLSIAWGVESAEVRLLEGGQVLHFRGYSMMILRREADGSWKFSRGLNGMKQETEEMQNPKVKMQNAK